VPLQVRTSFASTGSRNGQLCRCLDNLLITSNIACYQSQSQTHIDNYTETKQAQQLQKVLYTITNTYNIHIVHLNTRPFSAKKIFAFFFDEQGTQKSQFLLLLASKLMPPTNPYKNMPFNTMLNITVTVDSDAK